jgi:hypothetical protein
MVRRGDLAKVEEERRVLAYACGGGKVYARLDCSVSFLAVDPLLMAPRKLADGVWLTWEQTVLVRGG